MNSLCLSLIGGITVYFLVTSFGSPIKNLAQLSQHAVEVSLKAARPAKVPRKALLGSFAVVGIIFTAVIPSPCGWLGVLAGSAVLYIFRKGAGRRQRMRIEQQLPDALALIGNAMSAGFSLFQALSMVGREIANPVGGLFRRVVSQVNLGVSLDTAMRDVAAEIHSDEFDTVVLAMNIQRTTGGNLPRILEIVANTIREKQQLAGKLRSLTAQGRLTAAIVSSLPAVLLVVMRNLMPSYVEPLFEEPLGRVLLVLAGVMQIVGLWRIHRITSLTL